MGMQALPRFADTQQSQGDRDREAGDGQPARANHPLPLIQMFWHGPPLSRMERLSIASFLQN